jgi:hypothetical protein
MKNTGFLILGFFIFISCGSVNNKSKDIEVEVEVEVEFAVEIVGNDRDAHGCIGTAGYTWSQIRQECIRIFESGQLLSPIDKSETSAAFVVYGANWSKLELFSPTSSTSIILLKSENDTYSDDTYHFDVLTATLTINGEVKYRGN